MDPNISLPPSSVPDERRGPSLIGRIPWRLAAIWLALLLLVIVGSVISKDFLSVTNAMNLLRQCAPIAIIAMGMTFVIVSGGIDLSVGSIVALVGVLTAGMLREERGIAVALAAGLGAGALAGLVNGVGISSFKIPPFIMTLAGMTIYKGLAFIYSGGQPISVSLAIGPRFYRIGSGYLFDGMPRPIYAIPLPIVYMLAIFAVGYVLLAHTRFGVHVYAVGGNEEAARLSGVSNGWTKLWVYMISGVCSAIAAIVLTARLTSGEPLAGQGFELDAIAAVVVGGASLSGGKGGVWGTLAGALILQILLNIFNMKNVPSYYQEVFKGLIIIAAVLMQYKRSR